MQVQDDSEQAAPPLLEVTAYTDPFCSWCWAAEPVHLRLRETYGDQIHFTTVLGGLVENAGDFPESPGFENLRRHLMHVGRSTGQPIDVGMLDNVHREFSTWPACIHVKAAFLQGESAGLRYLRHMRLRIMTAKANGSEPREAAAMAMAAELDMVAFRSALADGSATQAFFADREACKRDGARGFPTVIIRTAGVVHAAKRVVGHRPYEVVEAALLQAQPELVPRAPRPILERLADYGPMTTRELAETGAMADADALAALATLKRDGKVERILVAGGEIWAAV